MTKATTYSLIKQLGPLKLKPQIVEFIPSFFFIGILDKKVTDHCPTFIFFTHLVLSIIKIQKYAFILYSKLNKWKPEKEFD